MNLRYNYLNKDKHTLKKILNNFKFMEFIILPKKSTVKRAMGTSGTPENRALDRLAMGMSVTLRTGP